MAHEKPLITPQTKVGDLLKDFPELEETLVKIAPAFKKLRSPMLRRTVARVTNLAQAARVGGVPVDELIQKLRRAVGQPDPAVSSGSPATDTPAAVALMVCGRQSHDYFRRSSPDQVGRPAHRLRTD
jgi:hypothetical protein